MGLPHKLKNFNVFTAGDNYLGKVPELALPKIAEKVESYRGGGMLAEVDIGMGLEKLEMEVTYGGLVLGIMRRMGLVGVAATQLRYIGAYQEDDAGAVLAAELVTQGKMVELDPGTAKVGDNTEFKAKHTLSYLKWTVNGRPEIEIDVLNNVWVVDGVDRMAEIRAALQQ